MLKYANFKVTAARLATRGAPLMRTAHRATFEYTPREGFLYVRSRAISSRTNDNFDTFPAEEIKKGYRTFIGKPVFVNHANEDHRRARGVILDAVLHEDFNSDGSPDTWCEVLMEVDALKFPKLAAAVLAGDIDRTSMGTDVAYSLCSFCGNKAATPLDYCFLPGTLVTLADGSMKPIEEMVLGDQVLTHDGVGEVNFLYERDYDGPTTEIKTSGSSFSVIATSNHRFMAHTDQWRNEQRSGEARYASIHDKTKWDWTEAGSLRVGDGLQWTYPVQEIEVSVSPAALGPFEVREGRVGLWTTGNQGKTVGTLPETIHESESLAVVLGLYLAEGNLVHTNGSDFPTEVQWSFHEEEKFMEEALQMALDKLGAGALRRYPRADSRGVQYRLSNAPLAAVLRHLSGDGSRTKALSGEVMLAPVTFQSEMLRWYQAGDGYSDPRGHQEVRTASVILARQLQMLGARTDPQVPSIFWNENVPLGPSRRGEGATSIAHIAMGHHGSMKGRRRLGDGYLATQIKEVTHGHYVGKVYNISVTDQHSYAVEGLVTKNCSHIPRLKGRRIRRTTASGTKEDVLVHEICYGLKFFENSLLVEDPADPTAYFLGVDDRGLMVNASKKTAGLYDPLESERYYDLDGMPETGEILLTVQRDGTCIGELLVDRPGEEGRHFPVALIEMLVPDDSLASARLLIDTWRNRKTSALSDNWNKAWPVGKSFYHGTSSKLSPGDVLVPGKRKTFPELDDTTDVVFISNSPHEAWAYSLDSGRERYRPHLYEVEPIGEKTLSPGQGYDFKATNYTVSSARIVRDVTEKYLDDWESMDDDPEFVRETREFHLKLPDRTSAKTALTLDVNQFWGCKHGLPRGECDQCNPGAASGYSFARCPHGVALPFDPQLRRFTPKIHVPYGGYDGGYGGRTLGSEFKCDQCEDERKWSKEQDARIRQQLKTASNATTMYHITAKTPYVLGAREDIHSPKSFIPGDYKRIGNFYQGDSKEWNQAYSVDHDELEANLAQLGATFDYGSRRGPWFDGNFSSRGTCDHCGARFLHGAVFLHKPTGELIVSGQTCAEKLGLASQADFDMFWKKKEVERLNRQKMVQEERQRFLQGNPRAKEQLEWLGDLGQAALDDNFFSSLIYQLDETKGYWSNAQMDALDRARDRYEENQLRKQRELERQKNATPCPNGAETITGEVLSTKWVESQWGSTKKMLVADDRGFKVWGTIPSSMDADRGDRVTFIANIEQSDDDQYFGFFKRPRKAQVLSSKRSYMITSTAKRPYVLGGNPRHRELLRNYGEMHGFNVTPEDEERAEGMTKAEFTQYAQDRKNGRPKLGSDSDGPEGIAQERWDRLADMRAALKSAITKREAWRWKDVLEIAILFTPKSSIDSNSIYYTKIDADLFGNWNITIDRDGGFGNSAASKDVDGTKTASEIVRIAERFAIKFAGYNFLKKESRKLGYGEVVAPQKVDTLRDPECPLCGETDAFDGTQCQVCNFIQPPEMFRDPNTDTAAQIDRQQEKTDQASADPNAPKVGQPPADGTPPAQAVTPTTPTVGGQVQEEAPDLQAQNDHGDEDQAQDSDGEAGKVPDDGGSGDSQPAGGADPKPDADPEEDEEKPKGKPDGPPVKDKKKAYVLGASGPGIEVLCPNRDNVGPHAMYHTTYRGTKSGRPGRKKCEYCGTALVESEKVWGPVEFRQDGNYTKPEVTYPSPEKAQEAATGEQVVRGFSVEGAKKRADYSQYSCPYCGSTDVALSDEYPFKGGWCNQCMEEIVPESRRIKL